MTRHLLAVLIAGSISTPTVHAELFDGTLLRNLFGAPSASAKHSPNHGTSHASGHQRVPSAYRTPYRSVTGGFSLGMTSYPHYNYPRPGEFDPYRFDNYVYDPYRFGDFREPDLLNDPYFRERDRLESKLFGKQHQRHHQPHQRHRHPHHHRHHSHHSTD